MSQDDFNFMEDRVEIEDFLTFRTLVIEMVLATDMKSHFGILDKFKRFQKARQEDPNSVDIPTEMNSAFAIAIKTADLIHCSRPLEVHHRWVDLITQEFCNQGDLEKARNMPVSPGMDRLHPPGALQQVGFTEIFVFNFEGKRTNFIKGSTFKKVSATVLSSFIDVPEIVIWVI